MSFKSATSQTLALAILVTALPSCRSPDNRPADIHVGTSSAPGPENRGELVGRAVLPAATFATGPTSGRQLGSSPVNGQTVPFVDKQPVQGFSAIADIGGGEFLAMPDNGFGSLENSADFRLRVYRIRPDFKTARGGSGRIDILDFIELRDPDKKIPFAITGHFTTERHLTGADFDLESMQRAADGTLWFGDEFGPFLLHTDATGKVLEPPIPLPDLDNPGREIRSPQNPFNEEASAVRLMNALRHHARIHGSARPPVFAPWYSLLDDANPATGAAHRLAPPPGSGLSPAASGIFNVASLKNAGHPVVVWTVNDSPSLASLLALKVDGLISDRPDLLLAAIQAFDANNDGIPGDYLTADGLIDPEKFDAQGHRGARDLRPENTLPSLEAALDHLMTTLEFDCGVTRDGIAIVSHDPYIHAQKVRRADGAAYTEADEVLIKDFTASQIQSTYIADKIFRGPAQLNDPALSPASLAFFGLTAASPDAATIYRHPRLDEVFAFVKSYVTYYISGDGSSHPDASKRAKNAARVRFNIETKLNPRTDTDSKGNVFAARTVSPGELVDAIASVIVAENLQDRADIQSFDFRTLLIVHQRYPEIRTVALVGDFPKFAGSPSAGSDDGTNLQPHGGPGSPWLAGLPWPYRSTAQSNAFRAKGSGGFEGLALSADGHTLLPLLEKPLVGGEAGTLLIHPFDIRSRRYTGTRYKYRLDPRGTAIGDFVMFSPDRGLVIERDSSQGDLGGFKTIYEIELGAPGTFVQKRSAADLMTLRDPHGLSLPSQAGDVGLGDPFAMPFVTIESVVVLDPQRIGVINDNNFPFSIGRHLGSGQPDDSEFILIELARPLGKDSKDHDKPDR